MVEEEEDDDEAEEEIDAQEVQDIKMSAAPVSGRREFNKSTMEYRDAIVNQDYAVIVLCLS